MNKKNLQTFLTVVLVTVVVVVLLWRFLDRQPQPSSTADSSYHLALGNPSGATDDPANADNFLMRKPYFALSYNNSKGTPNWVSWCLKEDDLGKAQRVEFYPDPDLPKGFRHITPHDYTGSGFDRGHMCPHSDRASTPEASKATFVMTNMIPQAPFVNQHPWADLEDYCRDLVNKRHQTLYIVSGPHGTGGVGSKGHKDSIGGKVTVPAKCWKVIVALDGAANADDAAKVRSDTRIIAVVMPNEESIGPGWAKHRTSVKEVETLTGYRFFNRVPAGVIDPLKAKVDEERIAPSHPRRTGD